MFTQWPCIRSGGTGPGAGAERTYLCTTIASLLESTCSLLSFIANICNTIVFLCEELYSVFGGKNFGWKKTVFWKVKHSFDNWYHCSRDQKKVQLKLRRYVNTEMYMCESKVMVNRGLAGNIQVGNIQLGNIQVVPQAAHSMDALTLSSSTPPLSFKSSCSFRLFKILCIEDQTKRLSFIVIAMTFFFMKYKLGNTKNDWNPKFQKMGQQVVLNKSKRPRGGWCRFEKAFGWNCHDQPS